jgi:hypothetical protein
MIMTHKQIALRVFPSLIAIALATSAHAGTDAFHLVPAQEAAQQPLTVTVDTGELKPILNAAADTSGRRFAVVGNPMRFQTYSNYTAFIERGEIRLFRVGQSIDDAPVRILPLDGKSSAVFIPQDSDSKAMFFILRVYGDGGRYDETRSAEFGILSAKEKNGESEPQSVFGRDNSAKRNIAIRGGTITIAGHAEKGTSVDIAGQSVPLTGDGRFVSQAIVPFGKREVSVGFSGSERQSRTVTREINVKRNDWFTVAIGDLTVGSNGTTGFALAAGNDPEFDRLYVNTRAAFYTKGRIGDRTRVTASLDTGETSFRNLFSNLNDKEPSQLLRRLDSTLYYPSYGDDSSTVEDAPTQGRFYLRVDHDDSKFVVGNFVLDVHGTDLAQLDRGLYGAMGDFSSTRLTSFGERKSHATAFASDPGTAPAREEFRGTGGSAYYLQRQDLSIGSERLRVEIRDRDSGLVVEAHDLRPQEDYDVDYIQGRILLTRPLSSTASDGQTVRVGSFPGNPAVLVVRYEYTPTIADIGGYTFGGRATQWLGETVRIGMTAQREATGGSDQKLMGADILVRKSAATFLKAEIAQSEGPAFGQANSLDGGLNFSSITNPGQNGLKATSWKVEAATAFADFIGGKDRGTASLYYEHLGAGFTGVGRLSISDGDRWGAKIALPITSTTRLTADYDALSSGTFGDNRALDLGIEQSFGALTGKLAFRHETHRRATLTAGLEESGARNDLAAQLGYEGKSGWGVNAFAQTTLTHDVGQQGNARFGVGGHYEINERLSMNGEISEGEGGLGANIGMTRRIGDNSETYLNYAVSTERTDSGFEAQSLLTRSNYGTLTVGGKTRFGNSLSVHGEERLGLASRAREFVHSYGLEFTPGKRWSFAATVENGQIDDVQSGGFDRTAATASIGYSGAGVRIATSLETRLDKGVARRQTSWLSRNSVGIDANASWRLLGRLNFAVSGTDQESFLNAGFVEGVLGFAYRPVDNDRLNALFKYTYLRDTATFGQVTSGGDSAAPKQRSQVVSADFTYKLARWLSLGGKYGYRFGEVALSRSSDVFVSSATHLGVARADIHIIKHWDILAEARYMSAPSANDNSVGALFAIYREINDNARLGVGYNLSDYSDNLTDQSSRSRGFFINIVGKI